MNVNVGGIDKILRIIAGLVLIGMAIMGIGAPYTWIGVIPLATGLIGWCPAYAILGMKTCSIKKS